MGVNLTVGSAYPVWLSLRVSAWHSKDGRNTRDVTIVFCIQLKRMGKSAVNSNVVRQDSASRHQPIVAHEVTPERLVRMFALPVHVASSGGRDGRAASRVELHVFVRDAELTTP